jgi:hypothetical protein
MNKKVISLAIAALAFSTTVAADGFYFGGGVYETDVDTREFDDDDNTEAFFLGYNIIDSNVFLLSAELGYYDLGEYDGDKVDIDADAVSLAAVAGIPVGPFIEIYAKAGIAEVNLEVNGEDFDDSETFVGVGIGFDFFDTIDIYAEYLEFDTEVDTEMVGVGIKFDFF